MKQLSEDFELIKASLEKESDLIELNEDKTLVRRKVPMPESRETLGCTVYVKGFPQTATLDELEEFFSQHSEHVQAIRFRRFPKDRVFKGSVFVEFTTEEEATRFAGLSLSYNETPLVIKSKMAYFEEKNAEKTQKSQAMDTQLLEKMGRGRLLKISDFPSEGITHENLKETLKESFPVAYVDFNYESGCAWIRFREPVAEKFVEEYKEKALEIGEHKLSSFHVATEEEQSNYYKVSMKPRKPEGGRGGQRGRGGRGGRGGRSDRSSSKRSADEPAEDAEAEVKKAKEDEADN
ncbi:Lupus La protein [Paramicrosporidium saccamoebae]|uniref:Lupus La protein n=1 Tax=Paramicrosporidium saccamoebae TaxID=1246581 RepID=A0A2H9TK55_9FUNG|nr:Lupus La protein [Paramicrosporidium saccamoebae]